MEIGGNNMIRRFIFLPMLIALCLYGQAMAQEIGQIKKLKGAVYVERAGKSVAAAAGMKLIIADTVKTGTDGAVGITLTDDTLLSAGPGTTLNLSQYAFNSTTYEGQFDTTVRRGTISMVSGKLVKQSPTAVRVITPSAIMGVRGTEFFVNVEGEDRE
jgi:hypothetical protein